MADLERTAGNYLYQATEFERLSEQLARSFRGDLNPAGTADLPDVLNRLSNPTVVTHEDTGQKFLLVFQYQRPSPLHYPDLLTVLEEADPDISRRRFKENLTEEDEYGLLFDPQHLPTASLARFREIFSLSAFDITQGKVEFSGPLRMEQPAGVLRGIKINEKDFSPRADLALEIYQSESYLNNPAGFNPHKFRRFKVPKVLTVHNPAYQDAFLEDQPRLLREGVIQEDQISEEEVNVALFRRLRLYIADCFTGAL